MSTGWDGRCQILQRDAEDKVVSPLRTHGWQATVEQAVEQGEYLIISAERGGVRHQVALLYSSATENKVYKTLAGLVEHILINGQLYKLQSYAYGIDKPVTSADDFHEVLIVWNEASTNGRFAPSGTNADPVVVRLPEHRVLLSEEPIKAIWLRLRQLQSVTLARKMVAYRAQREGVEVASDVLRSKAEGVAFALRNASDYFHGEARNVSQRILNLYYGSLAFAFAEILASPKGSNTLADIENSTKQGHGLYTLDGTTDDLQHLVVGVIESGFFPSWMKFLGMPTDQIPAKKPRHNGDLAGMPTASWLTIEGLFARIPEVSDLFNDIFDAPPGWLTPAYDQDANPGLSLFGKNERPSKSYVLLVDESARLSKEAVASFPGPISEIAEVPSQDPGRHFRVAVNHAGKETWWDALPVHHSPFERNALILPIFSVVGEYRAISVVLLYALSIVVRYRPSVWRRVQEGDLDHMRVLIEAFLASAERILPEQFLEKVTGQQVFAKQPGSFF